MAMFSGKTAWFSESVDTERKRLWFENGGLGETLFRADFIFSDHFDETLIMAASRPGSKYPVAIFHPKFINACIDRGGMDMIPSGKFHVLPDELIIRLARQFPEWQSHTWIYPEQPAQNRLA